MSAVEFQLIANAWLEAGRDLGIEVVSPFLLQSPEGRELQYVALLPQFGSCKGMLLIETLDWDRANIATSKEYGYSCLTLHTYGVYERSVFVNALFDWGWTEGRGIPPLWYSEAECEASKRGK
jgi:hypothetical protein